MLSYLRLRRKLWDDIHLCDMNLEFTSLISARLQRYISPSRALVGA